MHSRVAVDATQLSAWHTHDAQNEWRPKLLIVHGARTLLAMLPPWLLVKDAFLQRKAALSK